VKNIASGAMAAIEAGEAIVTGAARIMPALETVVLLEADAEWEYQSASILTSAPSVPGSGWSSTGQAAFGTDATGFSKPYAINTAWAPNTGIWMRTTITPPEDGRIRIVGNVENSCYIYLDGTLIHSVNAGNADITNFPAWSVTVDTTAGAHELAIYAADDSIVSGGDNTYIYARVTQAIAATEPICLWGGYGPIEIDGEEYQGIGARGLAQQTGGAVGGIAQGMTLSVSGVEAAALDLLEADEIKGGSVVLYRLIFASDGKTLLDAHVFDRGRVDTVDTDETIGGDAAISVGVESAARGLGRAGARRRADSDQRLIDPDDGYFKNTSYAGQKTLYWGGKRPSHARR
jgi:hypothetical protein